MSELVWIHRFNANELGLGSRGSFCLVPVEARNIFFPNGDFSALISEILEFEIYFSNLDQSFIANYTKPPSKTEHRLSLGGALRNYVGEESTSAIIAPGKIGCFYRKDNTICLTISEIGSAYDNLLLDFPFRNKSNNLITETVFDSTENQVSNIVSEPGNNYKIDDSLEEKIFPNTIYYGAPGTGKSYTIKEKLKSVPHEHRETVTFHPDYDYTSFVGGYRPISDGNSIKYEFVPQVFTNLYVKAWKNSQEQFYLVIEEINRGNCAEIFGDIFQLLDQNQDYTVTPSNELKAYLVDQLSENHDGIINGLKMPNNLTILATMNTSDQSLFPMDSAFKRRWDWIYIPIEYERTNNKPNPSLEFKVYFDNGDSFYWIDFIKAVNIEIKSNPNLGMDKCIGNYFIKPKKNIITLDAFVNKALFYLWNDVFKDEFGSDSIFPENITYEDFFPIKSNGDIRVRSVLESLGIEILDK